MKYILCLLFLLSPYFSHALTPEFVQTQSYKHRIIYLSVLYGFDPETVLTVVSCESNFNPDARNVNKNKSVDYSLFQINSIHIPLAKKNGLDITDPDDNITMAFILLNDAGYKPWSASKKCLEKNMSKPLPSYVWNQSG